MAEIRDALKRIVTALGGTSTTNSVKGIINEIADNAASGGGGITEYDFTVTATQVNSGEPTITSCDKTLAELIDILNEKHSLRAKYEVSSSFSSGQPGYDTTFYITEFSYMHGESYPGTIDCDHFYIDNTGAHVRWSN